MPGSDRQTILFINHWAANMGGAEHSLQDVLLHMAGRSDCHLVTSEDGALCRRARDAGITCHVVPFGVMRQRGLLRNRLLWGLLFSLPDIVSFLRHVLGIRKLVRKLAPSLIHANVPKSHMALFCLSHLGYRGACCFHIRELFARNSLPLLVYGALFPRRNATALAISCAVRDSLPKRMSKACTMIYNGVAVQKMPRSASADRRVMRYLYCGRVVPWKGCHLLIEMFSDAKKRLPDAAMELSLVGDTSYWPQEYRHRLAEDIRNRGLDKCCFLLPNTGDVGALYGGHDVFVNASLREPFGRSIAESQGAGLPVVSFESGGVSEIVAHGQSGVLVPFGDKESFVKAMIEFVRRPGLAREMGEAGRIRTLQFFDRDVQVPKIGDFLLSRAAG
jgi:glycosyltransferase involved in cell wall biosynthesis